MEEPRLRTSRVELPPNPFFYTQDQVCGLLECTPESLKVILWYYGRSIGACPKDKLKAVNIMPEGVKPEWRILERDFITYLRHKRIKYYTRGLLRS